MRLAWKLSLALLPGVVAVLGAFGYVRVQREFSLFNEDTRRDHRVLAETLSEAVASVWEGRGQDEALALVRRADESRSGMRIRWVALDGAHEGLSPVVPVSELKSLDASGVVQKNLPKRSERSWEDAEEMLVTYAGTPVEGRLEGAIEVSESLASRSAYLKRTVQNTVLLTLALTLVCALAILAIGVRLITKPARLLIEKARALGVNGPEAPLELCQKDEFGDLARALNETERHLRAARATADAESEARSQALEQLRHSERLATTGRLASALAHEIGTPLNVVSGHAQLMLQPGADESQAVDSAHIIKGQCERIAKLVRQLLDYARRRPPLTTATDLADVAGVTVDLLKPLASRRQVELSFAALDRGTAEVDAFQSQQALTNVVMNAIQASPPNGSVRVELARASAHPPDDPDEPESEYVVISVHDDGPGVPLGNQERVFEAFFTTKPGGDGTGLGLSITRDILREHGGWVTLESTPGKGTRFDLGWPVTPPNVAAGQRHSSI